MAVTNPRTKLVNFRLSEEEFDSLIDACGTLGARSVSDFARSAVLSKFRPAVVPAIETSLSVMSEKVGELESNLNYLMRQFGLSQVALATPTGAAYNPSPQAQQHE
jgi:hypothetical protein